MLKVEEAGKGEWVFVYSLKYEKLMDKFDRGVDLWEMGRISSAKKIYKEVVKEYPEFIQAYHYLGLLYEEEGREELAFENWLKGYQIGGKALPSDFTRGRNLLRWANLENRPFLRCTHALGLCFFDAGNFAKGIELFEFIILVNPNDNQGIRAVLAEGYLKIGNYLSVLDLCDRYRGDITVDLTYGEPFALFKMANKEKATSLLKRAIKFSPKVAKELLKKRHIPPETLFPDEYTVGGNDEAYYYWERSGILWKDPEMEKWLAQTAGKRKSR